MSNALPANPGWMAWLEKRARWVLLTLAAASLITFLATIPLPRVDGLLIGSDGVGYYIYLRSLVMDGDLDFANEYARLYPEEPQKAIPSPTGLVVNPYAVGPALLWLPFYLLAHLLTLGLRLLGAGVAADGYGNIYQAAVCLGSIVYGALGMRLVHLTARRYYPATAVTACAAIWLASNFIYYLVIEPSMAHMCSFFAVALMLHTWLTSRPFTPSGRCLLLGLSGGLVALVRQPDALLFLMPVIDIALTPGSLLRRLRNLALVAVGFAAVFWPQLLVWNALNGSPFISGYTLIPGNYFNWLQPQLLAVWFALRHGLFTWHPLLLPALAGLVVVTARERRLGMLFLLGFLVQSYVIASWSIWWQGDAFGGRMFIASLPLLILGLAALLQALHTAAWLRRTAAGVILVCVAWNALSIIQYRFGFISMSGPYTLYELTLGKYHMLRDIIHRLRR